MSRKEAIDFAKWFVHSRRKKLHEYTGVVDAKFFASDLMTELCYYDPFDKEHRLITEYKAELKKEQEKIK
jgi:hypothetical protein